MSTIQYFIDGFAIMFGAVSGTFASVSIVIFIYYILYDSE